MKHVTVCFPASETDFESYLDGLAEEHNGDHQGSGTFLLTMERDMDWSFDKDQDAESFTVELQATLTKTNVPPETVSYTVWDADLSADDDGKVSYDPD